MESMRWVPGEAGGTSAACYHCGARGGRWDRVAGKPYCPNCQELLVLGEGRPLAERTHPAPCAVCARVGSVTFLSFPLERTFPVAVELCAEHLRGLLGRQLGAHAFHQLRRQLISLDLGPEDLFLLHEAFYDPSGRALQPACEQ